MQISKVDEYLLPRSADDHLWELFHENSKLSPYSEQQSNEDIVDNMQAMHESLAYEGYPIISLPHPTPLSNVTLGTVLTARTSVRKMMPTPLSMGDVSALLYYSYGVTRQNEGTIYPRAFRIVPSAGALYPLEIYFYSKHLQDLPSALYHYNPCKHHLTKIRTLEQQDGLSESLIQPELALTSSIVFMITAVFERSVFKYGERGYRFILLEAGHVAQNLNLVGNALGLGVVNVGGFFDRKVDKMLGLDGITHSVVYLVAMGKTI